MFENYFPDLAVNSIKDITAELLVKADIKGLILDIDNTLVPTHIAEPDKNALEWISEMQQAGIKLCIVSNATRKRVEQFNRSIGLFSVSRAFKPSSKGFFKAAKLMGLNNKSIAVVGDQLFTDIRGGKKAGMSTILVKPLHKKEFFFVQMKRLPEKIILHYFWKTSPRGLKGGDNNG